MSTSMKSEYPPKADLRQLSKPLPKVPPETVDPKHMDKFATVKHVETVIACLNNALRGASLESLSNCLFEQVYWRDIIALTSHQRTISSPRAVASALLQMIKLRGLDREIGINGDPHFIVMNPAMMFIDCRIIFYTRLPALRCAGRMILFPVRHDRKLDWKIWVLSTWIEELVDFPENIDRLYLSRTIFHQQHVMKTDVLIIGAGTSGLMTAARLKALGVESIVLDQNAKIGDNWAKRYDSLRFHVPTSNCEMPYMKYGKELQSPHRLSKNDVAQHLQYYAQHFGLNTITNAKICTSIYNVIEELWTLQVAMEGRHIPATIICKHLVQATGLGSGKPNLPSIKHLELYRGLNMHSSQYKNAYQLKEGGVKTVTIVGSANTAFDIMRDCCEADLETTMIVRSPTYIFPYDYVMDTRGIGAYENMSLDAADRLLNTFPSTLDGLFSHELFAHLAFHEADRYADLRKAGFPVIDSRDPSVNILHYLLERGGGHYVDVGGIDLIAQGKVRVRGLVEPVAYTESGLRLSDKSGIDTEAIIWCTGFADKNIKETAQDILGTKGVTLSSEGGLGPEDIVSRLDATWGVDAEGEVRGVGKRHLNMQNYWVIGGTIQHQRWWSRSLVQQIKLALEGKLPPAYRETPSP